MLSFSEHRLFRSTPDGSWVRTGTDPDGNCFFNAYAYSVQPNAYRSMDAHKRKQYVMRIKQFFSSKLSHQDTLDLIDVSFFEVFLKAMTSVLEPTYKLPDLSKQPLQSISSYVELLYKTHPVLRTNEPFRRIIDEISEQYHARMREYVQRDGSWMFDTLIPLFMNKMEINIIMISHETGMPITHYAPLESCETIFMYHIHDHFESVGLYKNSLMKRVFEHASFP